MFFKNIMMYRFNKPFNHGAESLENELKHFEFHPCGSQDVSKFGFSNALGKLSNQLVHSADNRHLICATKEEKIIPAQVIKDALEAKVSKIEAAECRKLAKKEKDALKDEATTDLLPRAFSRFTDVRALIIPDIEMILIDASTFAKAEEVLALLRKALGSLPVIPLGYKTPVESTLTNWLEDRQSPMPFEIQDEAELKSDDKDGGVVKFKLQDLTEEEVIAHLATGKQCHKLAVNFGQSMSMVINSDCSLKKVKFSEEFRSGNDEIGTEDPLARMDADFALMSSELIALVSRLGESLGGLEDLQG